MLKTAHGYLKGIYEALTSGIPIEAGDVEIGSVEIKDGATDTRAKVGAVSGLAAANNGLPVASYPITSEVHIGEVGGHVGGGSLEFNRPNDTTAYVANDVIAAVTANSATTALQELFTARKVGGRGYVTRMRVQTNKLALTNRLRVHLYRSSQPPTAVPGDNSAMTRNFANRAVRLGSIDLPALAAQTDMSSVDYQLSTPFPFKCDPASDKIYCRIETLDAQAVDSGQTYFLETFTEED